MNGEYDRLRQLLLDQERVRIDALQDSVQEASERFERMPDLLAEDIERSIKGGRRSRLAHVLAEATADSLELAVRRKPQTVVKAVYPVIGPAIRRSIGDALRQLSDDLDTALSDTFSLRALLWRWESWRSGTPYAQVVLRHTSRYQVEHLFLIQPESGLLLGHLTATGLPELDADAVAGMFTAINQFVRDSVVIDGDESGIGSATVGGYRLAVSEGPYARLVAFVRGVPCSDFGVRLDELNEELHARHGSGLSEAGKEGFASADGLLEQPQLEELGARYTGAEYAAGGKRQRKAVRIVLAVMLLLVAVYAWLEWRWAAQARDIQTHLVQTPGLVVALFDSSDRGKLRVAGLMDPLATDPRPWLAQHHPQVELDWNTRPFVSLEPVLVQRRVAQTLGLPEATVLAPDARGIVRLTGSVPFPDWHRVRATRLSTPGVTGIDYSGLAYPDMDQVDAAIKEIETLRLSFLTGTMNQAEGADEVLAKMGSKLQDLERLGASLNIAFHLQTLGLTNEAGTLDQNRTLRQRRGEWLASRLAAKLHPPSTIAVNQDAAFALESDLLPSAAVSIAPYPAPVKP